jgi:hypothetical protein
LRTVITSPLPAAPAAQDGPGPLVARTATAAVGVAAAPGDRLATEPLAEQRCEADRRIRVGSAACLAGLPGLPAVGLIVQRSRAG